MRYLIMGCNGMAGHMISLYLKEQGHDVTGFARRESDLVKTIVGDAMDSDLVKETIVGGAFDYVINCIGVLNKDAEEKKNVAVLMNSYLPHLLAGITERMSTRIIHLSTDCVFSGKKGKYREDDLRDGDSFYARSKSLGELQDDKNITIRTSIIGPDRNENGIGLLNWFMKQNGTVKGYSKAIWTGLTTLQLAKVIEVLCRNKCSGIYNVVPDESISKYELLKLINAVMRDGSLVIEPDERVEVDKSLVPSAAMKDMLAIPGYREMVEDMAEWIGEKRMFYPKYYFV